MFQKIISRQLKHRHFWRQLDFDELSELYISNMFRGLSLSLTGLFVPVYMIRLHYSLIAILALMAWYFTVRCLLSDLLAGYTVAKIGPKHSMLIGYFLLIGSTTMFITLPQFSWPVWLLGGLWGASSSYFFIPFNVDFSKIKHSKHGGKELGYVNIMEKIGWALGPLLGGLVATVFGAQYIFLVAAILLIVGAMPLLSTDEPVRLNQHLDFKALQANALIRDAISFSALGIENSLGLIMWPIYLGLFVLIGQSVYAKLGILTSLSVIVSISIAKIIGQQIDRGRGREVLRKSALVNTLIHLLRPFVASFPVAFGINIVNEAVTVGYRMPFFKGLYDAADDLPGYRIVYLTSMELIASTTKAAMWWFLVIMASIFSTRDTTTIGFIIAAGASIVIMFERFRSLRPKVI